MECTWRSTATTSRCAPESARAGQIGVQPHLLEPVCTAGRPDLAPAAVRRPACVGEEPPAYVVGRLDPANGPLEAVSTQRIDAGVQQPGAVAAAARLRVYLQLADLAVPGGPEV